MKRRMKRDRGFSLIEVLASVTIFAAGAVGLAAATMSSIKVNLRSRQMTEAAALAQGKVEQLRSLDASTNPADLQEGLHVDSGNPISSSPSSRTRYDRKWRVEADTPEDGMSLLTITVSWGDSDQRVKVATYVCGDNRCS